LTDVLLRK